MRQQHDLAIIAIRRLVVECDLDWHRASMSLAGAIWEAVQFGARSNRPAAAGRSRRSLMRQVGASTPVRGTAGCGW